MVPEAFRYFPVAVMVYVPASVSSISIVDELMLP